MKDIVIYGAGGMGREIKTLIDAINRERLEWNLLGFLDDNKSPGEEVSGLPVLGGKAYLTQSNVETVVAIGDSSIRKDVVETLKNFDVTYATLIHPSCTLADHPSITVGAGSMLCAGTIITTDVFIGRHVLVNLATTIGHDSVINDFASLMPGVHVSGGVSIGTGCYLGTGSSILNNLSIANWVTVGAGAVVTKDVMSPSTVAGVPAKELKQ